MNTNNQTPDFYEIYDYYTTPFYQTTVGKIILILLALCLLGAIVYFVITRRKKRKIEPWEWATHELTHLNLATCKNKDDYKKFYFTLSSIIKKYLHKRYAWQTEDKTDEELVSFLHAQGFELQSLEMIKKMSEGSLWIKFANEDALKTQAETDLATALKIVQQTKPIPAKDS